MLGGLTLLHIAFIPSACHFWNSVDLTGVPSMVIAKLFALPFLRIAHVAHVR
jgi:hypothetical protein